MLNNNNKTVQDLKEQFMQECTILDPKKEYPGYTGKEKYFIVTSLSESELKGKYKSIVEFFAPYLVLNKSFIDARSDFKRNEDKHEKRAKRTEDIYGYVDGETEFYHKELVVDKLYDDLIKSIEIDKVYKAVKQLPKIQRERFVMHYFYGISSRRIATLQHVNHSAVDKSLKNSVKKIKRLLNINKSI